MESFNPSSHQSHESLATGADFHGLQSEFPWFTERFLRAHTSTNLTIRNSKRQKILIENYANLENEFSSSFVMVIRRFVLS